MIHNAEMEASAVQEASKLMSESLAGSITIGHMRILDLNGLREYDKKIKEYIDARIDEKLNSFNEPHNKYKIITGEE